MQSHKINDLENQKVHGEFKMRINVDYEPLREYLASCGLTPEQISHVENRLVYEIVRDEIEKAESEESYTNDYRFFVP